MDAGGALMQTTEVENYPGFSEGIMGPDLMAQMRAQAERFGAELIADDVTDIDLTGEIKKLIDTDGNTYRARVVILAMGSAYRKLGLEDEPRLSGRGVSWCATCDGFFFTGKDIAVVGGGDSAVEEATFLTRFANSVTLVHRRDQLRASQIMADRAAADPKITFAWNSEIVAMQGESKLESITLRDTKTGEERQLEVTGVFLRPSAMTRAPSWYAARSIWTMPATSCALSRPPAPMCREFSPAATWSTPTTNKPSPRPGPGAVLL
ncbi:thioredoxin reductase [Cutibacterium acnes JCM 18909]|nr:thioredoxin reductase [Cutibacterium acnes JCM 18909]